MLTTKTQSIFFRLPMRTVRPIHRSAHGKKLVLEVDISALKEENAPSTIDEMVTASRLEYFAGKTKGFTDAKKLIRCLAA